MSFFLVGVVVCDGESENQSERRAIDVIAIYFLAVLWIRIRIYQYSSFILVVHVHTAHANVNQAFGRWAPLFILILTSFIEVHKLLRCQL